MVHSGDLHKKISIMETCQYPSNGRNTLLPGIYTHSVTLGMWAGMKKSRAWRGKSESDHPKKTIRSCDHATKIVHKK
jgi:hypothetical protein